MAGSGQSDITWSVFNLKAQNFACKFILTIRIKIQQKNVTQKQDGRQKTKWPPTTKLSITQSIFKLEAPDFAC